MFLCVVRWLLFVVYRIVFCVYCVLSVACYFLWFDVVSCMLYSMCCCSFFLFALVDRSCVLIVY